VSDKGKINLRTMKQKKGFMGKVKGRLLCGGFRASLNKEG
jgi:hypothetical protein